MSHRVVMLATASLVAACSHGPVSPHLRDPGLDLTLDKQEASSGDSVGFSITFSFLDAPGDPVYLHWSFDAQPAMSDTLTVPPSQETLTGTFIVPANLPAGTLTVTVFMPRRHDSTSADVRITPHPPTRTLALTVKSPASPAIFTTSPFNRVLDFIAGTVDTAVITARDNAGVAWIGWALGPPANLRDSVAVGGPSAVASFPLSVPGGPDASPGWLEVFSRSQDGTLLDTTFTVGGVAEYLNHPVQTVTLAGVVQDMVYDAKRGLVYLSEQGQSSVIVLSLSTMTYASSIPLSGQPMGLDLVPSGDSLIVAIANTDDLVLIDLTSGTTTVAHLAALKPYTVVFPRVAADNRVLLVLGAHGGAVGDYNLPTGVAQIYDTTADGTTPIRSGDGSIVVMRDVGGCGLAEYDATTKEFMFYIETCGEKFLGQATASQNGARLNIGVELFNGGLASLGAAQIPDAPLTLGLTDGAAISPSGNDFYVVAPLICGGAACEQTAPGFYFRFALSSGATPGLTLEEIVSTPETPVRLLPIPGDQALLAVGPTKLMRFDLTQWSSASIRYAATGHGAPPRGAARRSRRVLSPRSGL